MRSETHEFFGFSVSFNQ